MDPLYLLGAAAAWLAFRKQTDTLYGQMTPEREEIYRNSMEYCKDPRKMAVLADRYQKDGLPHQAHLLRLRGQWRARSDTQRKQHQIIFHQAMASNNLPVIAAIAQAFEEQTATHMAQALRERIQKLQAETLQQVQEAERAAQAKPGTAETKDPAKVETKEAPEVSENMPLNGMSGHTEIVPKSVGPQEKTV